MRTVEPCVKRIVEDNVLRDGWNCLPKNQTPNWGLYEGFEVCKASNPDEFGDKAVIGFKSDLWKVCGHLKVLQRTELSPLHDCNTESDAKMLLRYCQMMKEAQSE